MPLYRLDPEEARSLTEEERFELMEEELQHAEQEAWCAEREALLEWEDYLEEKRENQDPPY